MQPWSKQASVGITSQSCQTTHALEHRTTRTAPPSPPICTRPQKAAPLPPKASGQMCHPGLSAPCPWQEVPAPSLAIATLGTFAFGEHPDSSSVQAPPAPRQDNCNCLHLQNTQLRHACKLHQHPAKITAIACTCRTPSSVTHARFTSTRQDNCNNDERNTCTCRAPKFPKHASSTGTLLFCRPQQTLIHAPVLPGTAEQPRAPLSRLAGRSRGRLGLLSPR